MKKKYDLIFIGRLAQEKGLDTIIEVARYANHRQYNINICVIGDGPQKKWLLKQIQHYKLKSIITYLGPKNNPYPFIQDSKILILPSLYEAFPTVILEAGWKKVPAIVANFPGASEIIKHNQTGWIIESRSEFPKKIVQILSNTNKLAAVSTAAKKSYSLHYSSKNIECFVDTIIPPHSNQDLIIPYWSLGLGGIETRLQDIIDYVLTHRPNTHITLLLKRQYPQRISLRPHPRLTILHFSQNIVTGQSIRFGLWCLKNILQSNHHPITILGFLNRFGVLAVFAKLTSFNNSHLIRVVISQESHLSSYLKHHEHPVWKTFITIFYRAADEIITLTKATKKDLIQNFHLKSQRITVIPGWIPQITSFK